MKMRKKLHFALMTGLAFVMGSIVRMPANAGAVTVFAQELTKALRKSR